MKILLALLHKEWKNIKRNPLLVRMVVGMPLMVMLVIPLVADMDVKNVNVSVVDRSHTILSRRIVSDINASGNLAVGQVTDSYTSAFDDIKSGRSDVILTIAPHEASFSIEGNGVNATKGLLGSGYVAQSVGGTLRRWAADQGVEPDTRTISGLNLYNPTLNFRHYMIPALITVLLVMICGFLPALNLVNEKEEGTIETMNVSPVPRLTFILSKLIPFWIIGMLVVTVGMTVGWAVYGLAPRGNIAAIYLAVMLFSLTMSGLGVTVANKSSTMLETIFVMFALIMIFQLLSGLFTPIRSMPQWAQCITYAIPPRYFIEIMRSIYLRGAGVVDLWTQYAALGGFALTLCAAAAFTYRKQS